MDHLIAGVDIGGSHITVALVDARNGEILGHTWTRLHVNSQESAESIISTWCRAIEQSFGAENITPTRLGIAMPGPFDYEKGICLIKNQNKYDALHGLNIKQMLSDELRLNVRDIAMTNDAACFLKGEMFGGIARNYTRVIGLTLGTGLGSARSVDGITEDADLWCSDFKSGIAEDYLSARWFTKRYSELSNEQVKDVKSLAALAKANPHARQVFDEFSNNLAAFLQPYIIDEHFELVILGGNIAQAFPLFSQQLQRNFEENDILAEVRQSRLGENASLVGAISCFSEVDSAVSKQV
jgi:glucokinase